MTLQKRCFILLGLLLLPLLTIAQEFYQHDTTVKVYAYGRQLPLAWCGGFNNPQFSNADLNRDGKLDLVVFEPGMGVMTLINRGVSSGVPLYNYAPEYALNFPPIYAYLQMADYNCDGIQDIFERGGDGISVYKGYYNSVNQLCFTFYRTLFYFNDALAGGPANAYVNPGDIPAVADVDGDGDLDFVAYYITGGYMYYYKNMRVEDGLPCDSIRIKLVDRCWGKVYQGFFRGHTLGYSCSNAGLSRPAHEGRVTHSGNSICLFDWDMDGDMDYLDGNVSYPEITFLKNGRLEHSLAIDSMIDQDSLWQTGGKRVNIPTWPAAFNVDIDGDGKKDLLMSPNAGGSENYKCIWYYKNNSTPGVANWQFQSDSFLTDQTIDVGTAAYPILFDYDKDGKLDLIVGSDGYYQSGGSLKSRLSYYRNTTSSGNASFTLISTDLADLSVQNFKGAAPATGDIDNDGKSDLIIGHTDGTLSFYRNMAVAESAPPDWQPAQLVLKDITGNDINVDGNAAPFIYDIDKDGRKDLIIGNIYGYIEYYRNEGTPGAVKLRLINTRLGKAKADPAQNLGNFSVPFIGKLDPTGIEYLLMGSNSGNLYQYTGFQGGDTTAIYTLLDGHYSYIDSTYSLYNHPGTYYGIYSYHRSAVTVGDIDGSGSYSLIKGNVKGGLEFYKRKVYEAVTPPIAAICSMSVYPNPASNYLNVSWSGVPTEKVQLMVYDIAGRSCFGTTLPSVPGQYQVQLGNLALGVYMCVLQCGEQRVHSRFSIVR